MHNYVSGDNPWPGWTRSELAPVLKDIVNLWDATKLRLLVADEISAKKKEELLKRESVDRSAIAIALTTIRLGPVGKPRFEQRLNDMNVRADFESAYSDKTYKCFMKELAAVEKSSASRPSNSARSRAPRQNRSNGNNRNNRGNQYNRNRPRSAGPYPRNRHNNNWRTNRSGNNYSAQSYRRQQSSSRGNRAGQNRRTHRN